MAYEKTNWTSTTPINTANLNKIENGIEELFENGVGGGGDSLPVGTIVEYEGETIPDGYEEVTYKNILFENSAGSTETITLSESIENYSSIEIEYMCNSYGYKTMRLDEPNGKNVVLDYNCVASKTVNQLASSIYLINGTNLTLQNSNLINHDLNGTTIVEQGNNLIKITKVVGYK